MAPAAIPPPTPPSASTWAVFVPVAVMDTRPLFAVSAADFVDALAVEAIVTFAVLTSMPASTDADTPTVRVFVTFATEFASIVIPPFLLSTEVKLEPPIPAMIVLCTELETMEMPNAAPKLTATVVATASAASDALSSATTSTSPVAATATGPSMEAVTVLAIVLWRPTPPPAAPYTLAETDTAMASTPLISGVEIAFTERSPPTVITRGSVESLVIRAATSLRISAVACEAPMAIEADSGANAADTATPNAWEAMTWPESVAVT